MQATMPLLLIACLHCLNTSCASEYEVKIGEKVHILKEDKATTVTTPKGESITITVNKRPILTYRDEHLSFSYGSDMKVSSETDDGIKTITVECENSALVLVQVYPTKMPTGEIVESLAQAMKKEVTGNGAKPSKSGITSVNRVIGGSTQAGKKQAFKVLGFEHENEVFAFHKGEKTVAIIFQADEEDRVFAEKQFKTICDSFK